MAKNASKTATVAGSVPSVTTPVAAAVGANLSPLQQAFAAARLLLPDVREVESVNAAGETVRVNVNNPETWQEMGAAAAFRDKQDKTALNIARIILKDAPYALWMCFGTVFQIGSTLGGYENAANLYHRVITAPLAAEGIKRPESPTSSNARPKVQADKTAKAAAAEALAKMSDDDIKAELKEGKCEPSHGLVLKTELLQRERASIKAAEKVAKDARTVARKAAVEAVDLLQTAELQLVAPYCAAIVARRTDSQALKLYGASLMDATDNAAAKTARKSKTKH
jgi:hypothetical protein